MHKIRWLPGLVLLVLLVGCHNAETPTVSTSVALKPETLSRTPNPYDFGQAVLKADGYSISVEITSIAQGKSLKIERDDLQYAEFIKLFRHSAFGRPNSGVTLTTENNRIDIAASQYILDFTLKDGSGLWFSASADQILLESLDKVYIGGFDSELHIFLEDVLKSGLDSSRFAGISIQPESGQYLYHANLCSSGTVLRSVGVRAGILDKDYIALQDNDQNAVKKGKPCWLITGQIESRLDQYNYMTMFARGYAADGREVARVLDCGPICGVISVFLPSGGFGGFVIHMNAAPDVVRIELSPSSELYDIPPP